MIVELAVSNNKNTTRSKKEEEKTSMYIIFKCNKQRNTGNRKSIHHSSFLSIHHISNSLHMSQNKRKTNE